MPWREVSVMEQREEFVRLALQPGANKSELCRRFGIRRSNGYKWLERYAAAGPAGLDELSRRPKSSPERTGPEVEAAVLRLRAASNGVWGGRKIAAALRREGCGEVPAPSTITEILRRHGELVGRETFDGRDVLRIEYYPTRLFRESDEEAARRKEREAAQAKPQDRSREREWEAAMQRMMNKVSLVTLWVTPDSHQIVKYTFDNVNMDFLPAAWLVRVNEFNATMTMGQPFKDVWLPRDVEFNVSLMFAVGVVDVQYHLDYHDYREAKTSGRIK